MRRGKSKAQDINGDGPPPAKEAKLEPQLKIPKNKGILLSCGTGDVGQLGLGEDVMEKTRAAPIASIKNAVSISAGGMHSIVLTDNGEVYSFGCNDEGALGRILEDGEEFTPGKIDLPGRAIKITAGDSHSACLLENGVVYAWGSFRVINLNII